MFGRKKTQDKSESKVVSPSSTTQIKMKEKAPKQMMMGKIGRILFWTFIGFVCLRGITSLITGPKVIQQVNNYGTQIQEVPTGAKGFAAEFATEYFTWDSNYINSRSNRLAQFITNIDADAGLDAYSTKGQSDVLTAEVSDAHWINKSLAEITVAVRRKATLPKQDTPENKSTELSLTPNPLDRDNSIIKTNMVVPVTVIGNKYVVQNYPRFIGEGEKANVPSTDLGQVVTDQQLIESAKKITTSVLTAMFNNKSDELKYFYAEGSKPAATYQKVNYSFQKVETLTLRQAETDAVGHYTIYATVSVKSPSGENFKNDWILKVASKGNEMYVTSIGDSSIQ
ncbi:conjugal transfer protein [Paenibacillus peoriae]|uniref:conjugal transfer protein n=1 Tax=Paenibacillus peoriae TaxID=59893 RepID=UPI00215A76D6|nr:conjugal transfer protein [Paenibacillus peoriae]